MSLIGLVNTILLNICGIAQCRGLVYTQIQRQPPIAALLFTEPNMGWVCSGLNKAPFYYIFLLLLQNNQSLIILMAHSVVITRLLPGITYTLTCFPSNDTSS